jgi:hypothetical protein
MVDDLYAVFWDEGNNVAMVKVLLAPLKSHSTSCTPLHKNSINNHYYLLLLQLLSTSNTTTTALKYPVLATYHLS